MTTPSDQAVAARVPTGLKFPTDREVADLVLALQGAPQMHDIARRLAFAYDTVCAKHDALLLEKAAAVQRGAESERAIERRAAEQILHAISWSEDGTRDMVDQVFPASQRGAEQKRCKYGDCPGPFGCRCNDDEESQRGEGDGENGVRQAANPADLPVWLRYPIATPPDPRAEREKLLVELGNRAALWIETERRLGATDGTMADQNERKDRQVAMRNAYHAFKSFDAAPPGAKSV